MNSNEKNAAIHDSHSGGDNDGEVENLLVVENVDDLKRRLSARQIDLMVIGGSIGTALFVSIGWGLIEGGPGSMLIGFCMYGSVMAMVNNCMAEMSVFMPVSGGFIRLGNKWVDEAFGFMLGWNFFLYEAITIPFEISAVNLVLTFWRDDIPIAAVCAGCTALYAAINLLSVKYYGEAEYWLLNANLHETQVLLILIVFAFTFVTMVGGNPQHDAYGFRYWNSPGAFAEFVVKGSLGRFQGFLAALWEASFVITGPEYVSMVAGEASNPRKTIKRAHKTLYWRFALFFIGGALAIGIVVPYNDLTLNCILTGAPWGGSGDCPAATSGKAGTGGASPYVIAMQNMGIGVLPHITNALLVSSIFSAGNTFVYTSSRSLYGMALDGQAPKFLRKCTKNGIPIYCYCIVMVFPLLSFLQIGSSSAQVIKWLANLTQAAQTINYFSICIIYICFYNGTKAQGFDRDTLHYKGYLQPFSGYFGACAMVFVTSCYGYTVFLPGAFDIGTFFSYYTMVFLAFVTYLGWKIVKKTKRVKSLEVDLVWERPVIDAYEAAFVDTSLGYWESFKRLARFKKLKHVE